MVTEKPDDDYSSPQEIEVNLDVDLLTFLREMHYLQQQPFELGLQASARKLLRSTDARHLQVTATRLETVVSKYNTVMRTVTEFELPLFERSLAKIDQVFTLDKQRQWQWQFFILPRLAFTTLFSLLLFS